MYLLGGPAAWVDASGNLQILRKSSKIQSRPGAPAVSGGSEGFAHAAGPHGCMLTTVLSWLTDRDNCMLWVDLGHMFHIIGGDFGDM